MESSSKMSVNIPTMVAEEAEEENERSDPIERVDEEEEDDLSEINWF